MIPTYGVAPEISLPEGDDCGYPARDEISEEGFGFFRGTWWIGRVRLAEAREVIEFEREIIAALDILAQDDLQFETLAKAVEELEPGSEMAFVLRDTPIEALLQRYRDGAPLGGLEIGVAGLTYALSAVGFLTAASCRAHGGADSWSDVPVVLFGAHKWRAVALAELVAQTGCGIGWDRDMLSVYAPSVRNLMSLAEVVLAKRASFKSNPNRPHQTTLVSPHQTTLGL